MTTKEEFDELWDLKIKIESKTFQKYLCEPLREKQDKLRLNFYSDSLKEAWKKGGKYDGIEEFFSLLKQVNIDLKNKKDELESQE